MATHAFLQESVGSLLWHIDIVLARLDFVQYFTVVYETNHVVN